MPAAAVAASSHAEDSPVTAVPRETDTPFDVGGQRFHLIIKKLVLEPTPQNTPDNETVTEWELRDSAGNTAFKEAFEKPAIGAGGFDSTEFVSGQAFNTKHGSGIMVSGEGLPSAPESPVWLRIFGIRQGRLVPIDSVQYALEFKGPEVDPTSGHDAIIFIQRTMNFRYIEAWAILWDEARLAPIDNCKRIEGAVAVDRCRYRVEQKPFHASGELSLRLYADANETAKVESVLIKPGSQIEFLETVISITVPRKEGNTEIGASVQDDESWLRIRVNGREGWIHSQDDFAKVGLPAAG